MGLNVVEASDGRDLWDVFRQQNIIPARQISMCSITMKIRPAQKFLNELPSDTPTRVAYGYDIDEQERADRTVRHWGYPAHLTPFFPLIERGVSKAQCFGYFAEHGVAPPRIYKYFQRANCLSSDTRFITSEGIKTLRECEGQSVKVLGHYGKWTDATVRAFGEQPLRRITFSRYGETKQVLATGEHRWFAYKSGWFRKKGSYAEVLTDELKPNDRMVSMFGGSLNFPISPYGIHDWRVVSVDETGGTEQVYCAVVPDGNAFTLDGNLFTGNCLPCKNFRINDWKALQYHFPEKFAEAAQFEAETGLKWMQDADMPRLLELPMLEKDPGRKGRHKLAGAEPAFSFEMGCDACALD